MQIVLLSKTDCFSRQAQAHARALWPGCDICEGAVGDPRPTRLERAGDVLISFLSPWIVTGGELARFPLAINFHPGSTDYPGTGCYNFALYHGAAEFGAVCHHMLPKVDTGRIVVERRFSTAGCETVETLKLATMHTMLGMFRDVAGWIEAGQPLPSAPVHWTRAAYTRKQMEALKALDWTMNAEEIARRTRATIYPGYPGPTMREACGRVWPLPVPDRPPLA